MQNKYLVVRKNSTSGEYIVERNACAPRCNVESRADIYGHYDTLAEARKQCKEANGIRWYLARNDFHNTTHSMRTIKGVVSHSQVKRCRRALCGMSDCSCAETILGTRGRQEFEIVGLYSDGSITID